MGERFWIKFKIKIGKSCSFSLVGRGWCTQVFFGLVFRSTRMLMQTELLDTCRCEDDKAESDAEKYFIRDRTISPRLEQIVFVALQKLKIVMVVTLVMMLLKTFPSRSGSSVGSWSIWQTWVFCWLPAAKLRLQQAEDWGGALLQVRSSPSLLSMRTLGAARQPWMRSGSWARAGSGLSREGLANNK